MALPLSSATALDQRVTKTLKSKSVLVGVTLLLMSVIPASAAPREIEYFCYEQAQQATLPLRPRGAWEAFMANCIANLTPTPTKKHNYRKH